MILKCWNGGCIYNKDGVCISRNVEISVFGECLSRLETNIYDESFWGEKK